MIPRRNLLRLLFGIAVGFCTGASARAQSSQPAPLEPFDTAVLLVSDPAVQGELGLRADQRARIRSVLDEVGLQIWVLRDWPIDKSRDRLAPLLHKVESGIRPILTKQQRQRLRQLMLQHRGPEGLLWPEIIEVLDITPDQLTKLREIFRETQKQMQEMAKLPDEPDAAKKHYQAAHDLRSDEQQKILAILTPQQEKGWIALRGKRFDLSTVGPFVSRAPELQGAESKEAWVNSEPLGLAGLRGQVVIVHFWTFGCINCIHNYEWLKGWQRDFGGKGVTLVGIHTPETPGEHDPAKVRAKTAENGLAYPTLIDNQKRNWDAWGNNIWPSVYLVDRQGRVRYWWYGELKWGGRDGEKLMRGRIQELLAETETVEKADAASQKSEVTNSKSEVRGRK